MGVRSPLIVAKTALPEFLAAIADSLLLLLVAYYMFVLVGATGLMLLSSMIQSMNMGLREPGPPPWLPIVRALGMAESGAPEI